MGDLHNHEYGHTDSRLVVGVEYGHVRLRTGLAQDLEKPGGNEGSNVGVVWQPSVYGLTCEDDAPPAPCAR
jgi:hypothetical protein